MELIKKYRVTIEMWNFSVIYGGANTTILNHDPSEDEIKTLVTDCRNSLKSKIKLTVVVTPFYEVIQRQ